MTASMSCCDADMRSRCTGTNARVPATVSNDVQIITLKTGSFLMLAGTAQQLEAALSLRVELATSCSWTAGTS